MHTRRNFGTMSSDWADRKNKKQLIGFHVVFQDGHEQDITGGLAGIPDATIMEHGHVMKAKAIEVDSIQRFQKRMRPKDEMEKKNSNFNN